MRLIVRALCVIHPKCSGKQPTRQMAAADERVNEAAEGKTLCEYRLQKSSERVRCGDQENNLGQNS